jgi:flavin reductase (DIM6/NTAB) family NADH-FMN oxidoreductase RutF
MVRVMRRVKTSGALELFFPVIGGSSDTLWIFSAGRKPSGQKIRRNVYAGLKGGESMKTQRGGVNLLYPTLTTLVGAMVNGKPNFIAIAHVGILNHAKPDLISLGMGKTHYTNQGSKENKTFSVNIPSETLVVKTDYVGIFSGKKHDKSSLFDIFYGRLQTAPMIAECPVNMECKLYDLYDTPTHDVFIGEIVESYVEESVLQDGAVDISKVKPLLFDMSSKKYWSLGGEIAKCWNIGKTLKSEPEG